jgi:excisionase family DNA binding protein
MTVQEAARELRIGENLAYEAVQRGEIPAIRIGRRWVIPTAAFEHKFGHVAAAVTVSA